MRFSLPTLLPLLLLLTNSSPTTAAIVDLYEDRKCQHKIDTRNVWDNSCASTAGFLSMNITYPGGRNQFLTTFSHNRCIGPRTRTCMPAVLAPYPFAEADGCIETTNNRGGSNAINSFGVCVRFG
ncbi:hypothetical protein QBC34DRAFT_152872 [Podospora aff. communis PSN243]|uniref:Uncharacterized protein n=1 Tax=Podospora aff. communis PSN243 TaxID=3040156 RepID=A0AAV9GEK2_9PEZI|nr:hypothetical protein QBC34DRAFT_152872 [Podospora aff. communis PSN243]